MNKVYLFSGLSGSGKTTIGKHYAKMHGFAFIEGDEFFKPIKQVVTLSDGSICSLYDSEEAIDWDRLNSTVNDVLERNTVVLATFLPVLSRFTFKIHRHVRFVMGETDEELIERCILARITSKRLHTLEKQSKDSLMVKEVVFPIYKDITKMNTPDLIVYVYDNEGCRVNLQDIVIDL